MDLDFSVTYPSLLPRRRSPFSSGGLVIAPLLNLVLLVPAFVSQTTSETATLICPVLFLTPDPQETQLTRDRNKLMPGPYLRPLPYATSGGFED